MSEMKIVFL